MKLLKLFACGLVSVVLAIAICLGLNYLFSLFKFCNGVGTSAVSSVAIFGGVVFVVYLFYPDQVAVLARRYLRKKIDDQLGAASQDSQERISKLTSKRLDGTYAQDTKTERMGVVIKKTNLQCLDIGFKTIEDLFRAIREEGRGRACIIKAMDLCCDAKITLKNRIGFRGLLEMVYEIAGDMFVTVSDFKTRIRNAEEILRYCDANSQSDWPYDGLECFASQSLMRIVFDAHRNDHFDLALNAYKVLASRQKWLKNVKPERLSMLYELIGVIWLTRDLNRGISYLNLAIEYNSANYSVSYFLAQLNFHEKHDYMQALEYANQSFAHLSEDAPEDMVRDVMTIQYFCYALKRDYFKAREIILNIDKELAVSKIVGNKAYLNFKCGDYRGAENLAAKALKMNPEEGSALNTMGMLLLHRGQYAQAIKLFMAALRTFKKGKFGSCGRYFYCELCNNCAIAYYENHDEESAKEWFDKALDAGCLHVDMRRYDALIKASASLTEKR